MRGGEWAYPGVDCYHRISEDQFMEELICNIQYNMRYMICLHMKTDNWLEDEKELTDTIYFITFIENL